MRLAKQINDPKLIAVPEETEGSCDGCILNGVDSKACEDIPCQAHQRSDRKSVIYKLQISITYPKA